MSSDAKAQARTRAIRRKHGLCTWCGNQRAPGKAMCDHHLWLNREYAWARYHRRKKERAACQTP